MLEKTLVTISHPRISKSLEWTRPFLESVMEGSNTDVLTRITAVVPRSYMRQHQEGKLTQHDHNDFRISIHLGYYSYKIKNKKLTQAKYYKYSRLDILHTLAHELAHFMLVPQGPAKWTSHNCDHKILECFIMSSFAMLLSEQGYISEEQELLDDKRNESSVRPRKQ